MLRTKQVKDLHILMEIWRILNGFTDLNRIWRILNGFKDFIMEIKRILNAITAFNEKMMDFKRYYRGII
jgi:hypothetical protein